MSTIAAHYFDGKRALRQPVTLVPTGGRIKIVGRDVDAEFESSRVRVSTRIAATPRWIFLPGASTASLPTRCCFTCRAGSCPGCWESCARR